MTDASPPVPTSVLPSRKRALAWAVVTGNLVFLAVAFAALGINPVLLFTDFHYIVDLVDEMLPPAIGLLWSADVWASVGETLSMAFIGTTAGASIAFLLAFLAARNTTPLPIVRGPIRLLLGAQRAAPDFAIMLVIVVAVGFGPFAGTLALVIGSTGMFGKLYADAIEQVDGRTLESLRVVGATRTQIIRHAVLPQVAPSFIANTLYLFEINVGGAIALGVFGGGGIGFSLHIANQTLNYPHMLAYILLIVVMMTLAEKVSDHLRRRLFALDVRL